MTEADFLKYKREREVKLGIPTTPFKRTFIEYASEIRKEGLHSKHAPTSKSLPETKVSTVHHYQIQELVSQFLSYPMIQKKNTITIFHHK